MTSTIYDLPPVRSGLALPVPVSDVLVDLGTACNAVGRAILHAQVIAGDGGFLADVAGADRRGARVTRAAALQLDDAAVRYLDQLISIYALGATEYAIQAVSVVADVASGRTPCPMPVEPAVLPSQVIADLDRFVPLVAVRRVSGDEATAGGDIAAAHRHLAESIRRITGTPVTEYDDPDLAAARPRGSVDLSLALPAALHRYAAALVWTLPWLTETDDAMAG